MKHILPVCLALMTSLISFANSYANDSIPNPPKIREYGIGFTSLNNFSLQYHWGNEKRIYRISAANISLSGRLNTALSKNSYGTTSDKNSQFTPFSYNIGFTFAILKPKYLSDKLQCISGPFIGFRTSGSQQHNKNYISASETGQKYTTDYSVSPSLGYCIGARYSFTQKIFLQAEINPSFNYDFTYRRTTDYTNLRPSKVKSTSYGNAVGFSNLSNSGAMLTFIYRLTKS